MRLHLLNDLHLEFGMMRNYEPPECDVVILAGDIATGVVGVMWAAETYAVPVIYVPGNHEYYGKRRYAHHLGKLREKAAGTNVHLLNDDAVVIDTVRFLGSTLWTDFDLYGTPFLSRDVAQRAMNDFVQIRLNLSQMLTAQDTVEFHRTSRAFLAGAPKGYGGKTVVVTHHAPSEMSSLPQYRGDALTPAFASRMENLILDANPVLWAHGHMHNSSDYRIGDTRVLCNPRGYHGHELNPTFNSQLVVEI